jgi:hypothetical protein
VITLLLKNEKNKQTQIARNTEIVYTKITHAVTDIESDTSHTNRFSRKYGRPKGTKL